MPVGYLSAVAVVAAGMALALRPLSRSGRLGTASWLVSAVPCEAPFVALYWLLACTMLALAQGDLGTPLAWAGLALAAASFLGTPVIVVRSLRARRAIERALDDGLGPDWRRAVEPNRDRAGSDRLPWFRILATPLPLFRRDVRRFRNLAYGDAGRQNRLDVYRHRSRPSGGPVLIHLHGGYFRWGRKSFEARALLHRLASRGWVCISANYRLRPAAVFPDYVVDAKKVVHWARCHAREYGADPAHVFIAGSSSGAHVAVTAALTPNDPGFQPGFELADTGVAAAIGLYGYYGPVDSGRQPLPSAPAAYVGPDAPPLLIAHGEQDTFVSPEHARAFVDEARRSSPSPVVHVELPGAQHSFDLFHSIRFETLIDGIEAFAAWVRSHPSPVVSDRGDVARAGHSSRLR
jgi:acetyl esterase/lipase